MKKRQRFVKKFGDRTNSIRNYLRRARTPKAIREISKAIGATHKEASCVSATLIRLVDTGEAERHHNRDGFWVYELA